MSWLNKLDILGLWNAGAPAPVSDTAPVPTKNMRQGTFGYRAFNNMAAGSAVVAGTVVSLRVLPVGGDASFTINGGNTIIVRQYSGFDLQAEALLVGPTIAWVSGVFDLFAETA